MLSKFSKISVVALWALLSANVYAEDDQAIKFDPEVGRGGQPTPLEDASEFRVCADKDNLPYSNDKLEGFENKIAELIASDLGKKSNIPVLV